MAALRLGIVGIGKHGARYAKHASEDIDGVEVAAVCRRDTAAGQAAAQRFGARYIADPMELIAADDINAVALVTAPHLLEELVLAAVALGKPLLVEKPVAFNLESGLRIQRALDDSGLYCMVGHTLRLNTVVNELCARVAGLGRLDTMVFTQRFPPQLALGWLDDPSRSGGGNIMHTGVHCFDLIRWISGREVVSVTARMRSVCTSHTEDEFTAMLTLDDGCQAFVGCSRTTEGRNGTVELAGERGQLIGDHVHNRLAFLDAEGRHDIAVPEPRHTVCELLGRFVAEVRADAAPSIRYRDGLAAVAIADACYRSAASNRSADVVTPGARA